MSIHNHKFCNADSHYRRGGGDIFPNSHALGIDVHRDAFCLWLLASEIKSIAYLGVFFSVDKLWPIRRGEDSNCSNEISTSYGLRPNKLS